MIQVGKTRVLEVEQRESTKRNYTGWKRMLPSPISEVVGRYERRFLTASLLPTFLFVAAYASILVIGTSSFGQLSEWWQARTISEQTLLLLVGGALVWFLASLFAANWRKIVRFYEGYPLRAYATRRHLTQAEWARLPGVRFHLRKQLEDPNEDDLYFRYAPDEFLHQTLPTTIGNVLLAAERYAESRYHLDITLLWPRLYWQLPENVQQSIDRFKEEHQIPLALSFLAAMHGILSGFTLIVVRGPWDLFVVSCGVSLVVSIVAYLLAIERTEEYAEQLRTIVDLYRRRLVEVWKDGPQSWTSDEQFFETAEEFVRSGLDVKLTQAQSPSRLRQSLHKGLASLGLSKASRAESEFRQGQRSTAVEDEKTIRSSELANGGWFSRFRLLAYVFVLGVLAIGAGSFLLAKLHAPVDRVSVVGALTLPVFPAPSASLPVHEGERVDVIIRPCGILLKDVELLEAKKSGNKLGHGGEGEGVVTFPVDSQTQEKLARCSAEDVSIIQKG